MKVSILQWVDSKRASHGTVERISTTGADCVNFFKMQMNALGLKHFTASEEGQLILDKPEYCQFPDQVIKDYGKLQQYVQRQLDADLLGCLHIRAVSYYESENPKYFKIQFRNVH